MGDKKVILQEIKEYIKSILVDEFHITALNEGKIDDESDLFEELRGFDSIDALELLVIIEQHYEIEDSYDDMGIEFLRSVASLSEYVYNRKYNSNEAALFE